MAGVKCPKESLPGIDGKGKLDPVKDAYEIGEAVKVECKAKSHVLSGAEAATCGKNGAFSVKEFVCKRRKWRFNVTSTVRFFPTCFTAESFTVIAKSLQMKL